MTKYKGPLYVGTHGAPGTEVSYATIDASGTASFAGDIHGSAAASFVGPVTVGAGSMTLVQRTTILSNNSAGNPAQIVLPSGADIIDFHVDVEVPFVTGATATATNIEISAANGSTIAILRVSASTTRYGPYTNADTFNGSTLRNVTTTIEAHTSVVGDASGLSDGQAMLSIVYIQN